MGNYKNLSDEKAIAELKKLAEDIKVCMFCTELTKLPINSRPMGVREVDEFGNLWFLSAQSSNKNFEIEHDDRVQLFFAKNSDVHFLSVFGRATIYRDQSKVDDIWTPIAKAWFEEGKNDPDVSVIKVTPEEAYYWDTKNGKIIETIKIAFSALTGIHSDSGVQGNIRI